MNKYEASELLELSELLMNEEEKPAFTIDSLDKLNWAFRKLSIIKAEDAEIKAIADKEIERIIDWSERESNKINRGKEFLESHIQAFHTKQLEDNPKAKTISTPYGKTKSRKVSPKIKETDREKLIEYVVDNNLDNYLKFDVKWNDLKKTLQIAEIAGEKVVVTEDGEILEGVEVTPESISYSVEVE